MAKSAAVVVAVLLLVQVTLVSAEEKESFLNLNKILGSFAKAQQECGKLELFQCRSRIKDAFENCAKQNYTCMKDILDSSECEVCFCKVYPDLCQNSLLIKDAKPSSKQSKSTESGIGDIMSTLQIATQLFGGQDGQSEGSNKQGGANLGALGEILKNPLL